MLKNDFLLYKNIHLTHNFQFILDNDREGTRLRLALTHSPSTRARSPTARTEKIALVEKVPLSFVHDIIFY